eukprot:CAMPEP_0177674990 /NCGR_PEP_ID=MMETSP0447-20121125/26919_1 /TAXON_ID=0 /ORGANISM="Stygamoeba regulata, Strain BSH-02190019" /LENGTH=147 /DNA_ID=CAMNT_0019183261 /DNA_START=164 /DNA_END=607 /DNA_ORIENTATION=+
MFLVDWMYSLLYYLGLYSKTATLLLLGLDNAGKTTLLHKLKCGSIRSFAPTQRAQLEEVEFGNLTLRTWDLGGHEQVRTLWKEYLVDADAIIFMVDTADRERLPEAQRELACLMAIEGLSEVPLLVLGNKTDLADCVPVEEVSNMFD